MLDDGLVMVFVTHDFAVVRTLADSVTVRHRGRVAEHGAVSQVLAEPTGVYARALLAGTVDLKEDAA